MVINYYDIMARDIYSFYIIFTLLCSLILRPFHFVYIDYRVLAGEGTRNDCFLILKVKIYVHAQVVWEWEI